MFAADHNGRLPDNFSSILEYIGGIDGAQKVFLSPFDPRYKGAQKLDNVDTQSSYILNEELIGKRLHEIPRSSFTPLAWERLENHKGDGTIVAFADVHVEWVDKQGNRKLRPVESPADTVRPIRRAGVCC